MKKKKRITTVIVVSVILLMLSVVYSPMQARATPASIQAYWRFDAGAGNVAYDTSDNVNDGLLSGGKFGRALEFDGSDDYVDVADSSSLDTGTQFTVEAWFKTDDVTKVDSGTDSQTQTIVMYGFSNVDGRNNPLHIRDGKLYLAVRGYGTEFADLVGTTSIASDTWYHAAVTYDGTDAEMYLNGVLEDSEQVTMNMNANSRVLIGRYQNPLNTNIYFHFDGLIDEVRISSVVRYSADFTPQTSPFSSDTDTVALWHFGEGTSSTAGDSSANSNDGTIYGATWTGTPPTWVDGKYGKALEFDGIDDKVVVKHDSTLDMSSAYTVEAWVYRDSSSSSSLQYIVAKDVSTSGLPYSNYNLLFWNDKLSLLLYGLDIGSTATKGTRYSDAGGGGIIGETAVSEDIWHHVAGVYTGSELRIYLDGVLEGAVSVSGTPSTNTDDMWIGMRKCPSYNPGKFQGIIDEVRIWSKALTVSQIGLAMDGKLEILPQAGLVIFTSVFHGLNACDTITIEIVPDDSEVTIRSTDPLDEHRVTPKKADAEWSIVDGTLTDTTVDVHIDSMDSRAKTIHLWLYLSTGEHMGVNLQLAR